GGIPDPSRDPFPHLDPANRALERIAELLQRTARVRCAERVVELDQARLRGADRVAVQQRPDRRAREASHRGAEKTASGRNARDAARTALIALRRRSRNRRTCQTSKIRNLYFSATVRSHAFR